MKKKMSTGSSKSKAPSLLCSLSLRGAVVGLLKVTINSHLQKHSFLFVGCCWFVRNKFKYYHNTKSVIINGFTWFMRCCCHIIKLSGNQLFCRKAEIGQLVSVPIPVAMGNMWIYWPSAPKYKSFSRSAPPLKKIVKHCFSSQGQQMKLG